MRASVRGILAISVSAIAALSACVNPETLDDPATTSSDSTHKTSGDSSKTTPPPDTTKKTPPPVDTSKTPLTPTATAQLLGPAQTVKGWGMYPAGGAGLYGRQQVSDAIYASGITFVRVQLAPALYVSGSTLSDMTLDPTNLGILIQALQNAQSYGVNTWIASVWSPPAQMKTNNSVNGGSLDSASESAYVAYLTKIVLSVQAAGVPLPAAISIQNEPEVTASYTSAVYTVAQWQRVIIAVRASFDANGLSSVPLFGPESGEFQQAVLLPGFLGGSGFPSLGSSALNHAVGNYAFHAYGECQLQAVGAGFQAYPRDAWMTEFSAPNGTTETAWMIDTYRALAAHLVVLPFNYWAWWLGWSESTTSPDGGSLLGGNTTPIYSKRYWALKQLWTTVRPGWVVTPMSTTDPNLYVNAGNQDPCQVRVDLLAFTSPDRSTVAVLMTNTTTANKVISISGLPGTNVQAYRSDASNDMVPQTVVPVINGVGNIPLPPGSAVLAVAH
jgi:glucuronoarabinoxylan endo-1,4-beta-xylanase